MFGWIIFNVMVLIHLGSDFVQGLLQITKAIKLRNIQLMMGGFVLFSVTMIVSALALKIKVILTDLTESKLTEMHCLSQKFKLHLESYEKYETV